jgi:hypothetical protein
MCRKRCSRLQAYLESNATASELCSFSTALAKGAACGDSVSPDDICWILSVATVNSDFDEDACSESVAKGRCARVTYRASVFQRRAAKSSEVCSPGSPLLQGEL